MNKYWLIPVVFGAAVVLILGAWFVLARPGAVGVGSYADPIKEAIHYHAGFQIYIDDKLQDFSGLQYMDLKPCETAQDGGVDASVNPTEETLDLHNGVGDVVHVHHAGMTWSNLAQYVIERSEADISEDEMQQAEITAYVNGEKVNDILSYPIKAYDSVVVFIGKTSDIPGKLKNVVTIDHIKDIEADKENCGS
jgi:hypothetical protein